MEECIFCKIRDKQLPADFVYEDEKFFVIKDINPKAPVHLLIIPKKHIFSVASLTEEEKTLAGELIFLAKKIADDKKLPGYKLVFNVGREGGQIIDHLHLHLLSGRLAQLP
jgi:histidine triad (HIT) family protein